MAQAINSLLNVNYEDTATPHIEPESQAASVEASQDVSADAQGAACRTKKRTSAEMLEQARQDLAKLSAKDVSIIDAQKLSKHEAKMAQSKSQISGYESKMKNSPAVKRQLSVSNDTAKRARLAWSDDDIKRLIHARTEHNASTMSAGPTGGGGSEQATSSASDEWGEWGWRKDA
jgi:hypothetical protein